MLRSWRSLHLLARCTPASQQAALLVRLYSDDAARELQDAGRQQKGDLPRRMVTHPPQDQLVALREEPTLLGRWVNAGLIALHRLLEKITLRGTRAPEVFVRRMLEEEAGLDPWTLDFIALKSPDVFQLSWQHDIEPVVAWLRSKGLHGGALAYAVAACPALLRRSPDEQLQPLSELVEGAGGALAPVLLRCPRLAEAPVELLRGTAHVLRQLGCSRAEAGRLLVEYPDLYAKLAGVLEGLFRAYGRLGVKAYVEEQRRYAAQLLVQQEAEGGGGGGESRSGGGGEAVAAAAVEQGQRRRQLGQHVERQFPYRVGPVAAGAGAGEPVVTQFVCEADVGQAMQRVADALRALAAVLEEEEGTGVAGDGAGRGQQQQLAGEVQGEGPEGRAESEERLAALGELQLAIDRLAGVEGICLRRD